MDTQQTLWSVEELAEWANICNRTAYRLVKTLPEGVRLQIGGLLRVDPEALKKHLADNGGKL